MQSAPNSYQVQSCSIGALSTEKSFRNEQRCECCSGRTCHHCVPGLTGRLNVSPVNEASFKPLCNKCTSFIPIICTNMHLLLFQLRTRSGQRNRLNAPETPMTAVINHFIFVSAEIPRNGGLIPRSMHRIVSC